MENTHKNKLPIGICERCKKKGHVALFMGKRVCSNGCYEDLKWRRKCRIKSKVLDAQRKNPYKRFDDKLFAQF